VAMGYWDATDLPFYHGLASTFPVCDRWFSSVLAQTYPNRRFLMAGTANGVVSTTDAALLAPPPPNGTIFDRFAAHGIPWRNYYSDLPSSGIILETVVKHPEALSPIERFFADAAAGTLPSFSLVDPDFDVSSEENPQDVQMGERFAARGVDAVMKGPGWPRTLLVWCYDETAVLRPRPPAACDRPDRHPPDIHCRRPPGGYDRYGFRVPAVIVSPFARRDHVSHRCTTTLVLKCGDQWNLGALTYRDANADDLLDSLDLGRTAAVRRAAGAAAPGSHESPRCTPRSGRTDPTAGAVFPLRRTPRRERWAGDRPAPGRRPTRPPRRPVRC